MPPASHRPVARRDGGSRVTRTGWPVWAAGGMAVLLGVGALWSPRGSETDAVEATPTSAVATRLPDLDQEAPSELEIQVETLAFGVTSYRLGFRSAVGNIGMGPLTVEASRETETSPTMTVDQIVAVESGTSLVVPGVGQMEYAVSPQHSHWHYLDFQDYELRSADGETVVADRKSGFCLGDRYRVAAPTMGAAPLEPVYRGNCGPLEPARLQIREGISVGYGDDYAAFLEGQDVSLDGLPDGRYTLVHRVNVDRSLQELSYDNNAASALLELRWQDGTPRVRQLASCADSDECDFDPTATVVEVPVAATI